MKRISASKFKAQCLAVIDSIQSTGEPVLVTKNGKPLVKLVPVATKNRIFGHMAGKARIVGDIVSPATPLREWNALK